MGYARASGRDRGRKELGINGKQQIEEIGVEKFNALCRESVWRYKADWEKLSERIGYWLDYDNAYITYTNNYIESVWWALATLYERDLLYRGYKILPYCPRCGTALSSHEVAQGWKDVKDPSVYIALDLVPQGDSATTEKHKRRILVWTTTPWTLVSNVALAVNPDLEYVELVRRDGDGSETVILAESRAAAVLGDDYRDRWEIVATLRGSDLVGRRYRRPLDWVDLGEGKHEIIVGESFVSSEDGTGVVHMAPAFGADDYASGSETDCRSFSRWISAESFRPACRWLAECSSRRRILSSSRSSSGAACCGRRGKSSTRIRTAGAARRRSSTTRAAPGSFARLRSGTRCSPATRAWTGIRPKWARAALANGSRTTSTGPSRATVTGERRFRSGSATPTMRMWRRSEASSVSESGWARRFLKGSILTSPISTGTHGNAPNATERCAAFRR